MGDSTDSKTISISQPVAEEYTRRTVTVDLLYLDDESCDRCRGTQKALEEALERIEPLLGALDVGITVRDIHVSTLEAAEATQLAVSPTIRIDGRDIQPDYLESTCESCGELCECTGGVDCRLWRYRGEEHSIAPVGLLVESLVQAMSTDGIRPRESGERPAYRLSSNVRDFFEGSASDESDCRCGCQASIRSSEGVERLSDTSEVGRPQ